MIVNRRTFNAVPGQLSEVIERLKLECEQFKFPGKLRVYTTHSGRFDTLVTEHEFESLAQYETFWNEWFASEQAATLLPYWRQATLPGGVNELYEMAFELP